MHPLGSTMPSARLCAPRYWMNPLPAPTPSTTRWLSRLIYESLDGWEQRRIQGNALYNVGDTGYFIDGGGGGSPYALHEVGTDSGTTMDTGSSDYQNAAGSGDTAPTWFP